MHPIDAITGMLKQGIGLNDLKTMAESATKGAGETPAAPILANASRRAVLGGLGALVLALTLRDEARAEDKAEPKKFGADAMPHGWRDDPKIFVEIARDGTVTVTNHRSDMGQGVRTSVALVVAVSSLAAFWSLT